MLSMGQPAYRFIERHVDLHGDVLGLALSSHHRYSIQITRHHLDVLLRRRGLPLRQDWKPSPPNPLHLSGEVQLPIRAYIGYLVESPFPFLHTYVRGSTVSDV